VVAERWQPAPKPGWEFRLSNTVRSTKLLEAEGWTVDTVERWIPVVNRRKDLFGFLDLIAVRGGETMGIQTTSASNVASRINKIMESEHLSKVRMANWRIEVHGWAKKANRWVVRREDIS
jgi:hypothetical protein